MTGKENYLPVGWEKAHLGNLLCLMTSGKRPKGGVKGIQNGFLSLGGEHIGVDGTIDLTKPRYIPHEFVRLLSKIRALPGDILIVKDGATTSKSAIVDERFALHKAFINEHIFLCRVNQQLNNKFIFYYLRSPRGIKEIMFDFRGAAQGGIGRTFVERVIVPFPTLNEQHRIVAKLDSLFARSRHAREELERIPKLCDRYRQAVLAAAFRGDLTADWREENSTAEPASSFLKILLEKRRYLLEHPEFEEAENNSSDITNKKRKIRYKNPMEFREERLFNIPKTWMFASADQVSSQITDGEHIQPPYQLEGIPMLSAKHVRDGYVDMSNIKFISKGDFEKAALRCAPENGDVLIVSVGATTGRAAIVFDCPPFAIVRSVLLMKPLVLPKFIYYWISSPFCQDWISKASGASAQPHFYINDNKRMPMPLPPEAEVQEIVRRVEKLFKVIDLMEQEYQKASSLCDRLEQAILTKAFRGELVPQDPNDEPASVLLERILTEQQEDSLKGKRTKGKIASRNLKDQHDHPTQTLLLNIQGTPSSAD